MNTLFEERLFDLAVLIHGEEANPEHSILTRDVDLMVRRSDLARIQRAAAQSGFVDRHAAGMGKNCHHKEVMVVPVSDLVQMKPRAWSDWRSSRN